MGGKLLKTTRKVAIWRMLTVSWLTQSWWHFHWSQHCASIGVGRLFIGFDTFDRIELAAAWWEGGYDEARAEILGGETPNQAPMSVQGESVDA